MSNIQSFAKLAKTRMKSGYWNGQLQIDKTDYEKRIDEMYLKVCDIMESNEIVTNPIVRLMDKEHYVSLSEDARALYVLQISRIYVLLKQKYLSMANIKQSV